MLPRSTHHMCQHCDSHRLLVTCAMFEYSLYIADVYDGPFTDSKSLLQN